MSHIKFTAQLTQVGPLTLLQLPLSASSHLPSRGQTMVEGTLNGFHFQAPLEPDGKKSHWLEVDLSMLKGAKAHIGDSVTVEISPTKEWPEPKVPADLQAELRTQPKAFNVWKDITPMARWDWIRWIQATKNPETRKHRIEVACSKLTKGSRRPCCFNRTECTVPDVSHNGKLMEFITMNS